MHVSEGKKYFENFAYILNAWSLIGYPLEFSLELSEYQKWKQFSQNNTLINWGEKSASTKENGATKLKSDKENKANIKNKLKTRHCWPRRPCIFAGDSMLEDIAERKISSKWLI